MTYDPPSITEQERLHTSHTKQVENLIHHISEFTGKNFSTSIRSDGTIESKTCIPNCIEFADDKLVEELKKFVFFLHEQLESYEPSNKWFDDQRFRLWKEMKD